MPSRKSGRRRQATAALEESQYEISQPSQPLTKIRLLHNPGGMKGVRDLKKKKKKKVLTESQLPSTPVATAPAATAPPPSAQPLRRSVDRRIDEQLSEEEFERENAEAFRVLREAERQNLTPRPTSPLPDYTIEWVVVVDKERTVQDNIKKSRFKLTVLKKAARQGANRKLAKQGRAVDHGGKLTALIAANSTRNWEQDILEEEEDTQKVWDRAEELLRAKKKGLRVRLAYRVTSSQNDPLSSDFDAFREYLEDESTAIEETSTQTKIPRSTATSQQKVGLPRKQGAAKAADSHTLAIAQYNRCSSSGCPNTGFACAFREGFHIRLIPELLLRWSDAVDKGLATLNDPGDSFIQPYILQARKASELTRTLSKSKKGRKRAATSSPQKQHATAHSVTNHIYYGPMAPTGLPPAMGAYPGQNNSVLSPVTGSLAARPSSPLQVDEGIDEDELLVAYFHWVIQQRKSKKAALSSILEELQDHCVTFSQLKTLPDSVWKEVGAEWGLQTDLTKRMKMFLRFRARSVAAARGRPVSGSNASTASVSSDSQDLNCR